MIESPNDFRCYRLYLRENIDSHRAFNTMKCLKTTNRVSYHLHVHSITEDWNKQQVEAET